MGHKAARTAMVSGYGKQAQSEGAGMNEVAQFKRKADAVIEAAEEFEGNVLACVVDAQEKGVPAWMMLGKMMEVIADLQHGGVVLEPEDGA
ncbi:hypothetical protein FHW81_002697 [Pseudomonas sp. RC10-4-2]|uniref:hypothetical protein n=1 Tax=Pseudomonas sp. RC10-4-2 TaxID=2587014 RepID=UPI003D232440